jgi:hypothetical protein
MGLRACRGHPLRAIGLQVLILETGVHPPLDGQLPLLGSERLSRRHRRGPGGWAASATAAQRDRALLLLPLYRVFWFLGTKKTH